eukprot:TRINITY_DN2028_c0_g1_i3.p1 TRINITY_DN2028_c0_g1~~TRINITY_DN2028_c0_g1_i3.p1  ORF type:complete len:349 (-),score=79.76 TRINITY_DN2028_c0_g1_i3:265-1155(-)
MERKDISWLIAGGFILAAHAGYLNVICLMDHQAVGHTTGLMGNIAVNMSNQAWASSFYAFFMVTCFITGAFVTGLFAGSHKFHLDSRYGLIIIFESLLLLLAFAIFNVIEGDEWNNWAYPFVAIASGMQNAMCTTFSGAVIRTTHTTGTSTDIGLILGQWARDVSYRKWLKKKPKCQDQWKLKILLPLWFGYLFGAFIGAVVFQALHFSAMGIPGVTLGFVGIGYLLLRSYINIKNSKLPEKLIHLENDVKIRVGKIEKDLGQKIKGKSREPRVSILSRIFKLNFQVEFSSCKILN